MNQRLLILIPIVLSALMLAPSVPKAHAATGLVCVTNNTNNACPPSPFTLGPYTVGSKFSVGIFIKNSDAMGGYDIYVKADPAVLNPTGASLGTLIANPSLTSICINGIATTGSCTVGTANNPGVVEVTTIESTGGNECAGLSPCSGMAFFINYTVIGAATTTALSFPTAPGCSVSSVATPANVCVQVADSTGNTLSENIQGATVTQSSAPPPDFDITALPSSLIVASGHSNSSLIRLNSLNGFSGNVNLSLFVSPLNPFTSGGLFPLLVSLSSGGSVTATLTFQSSYPGNYTETILAMSGTISHSIVVPVYVVSVSPPPDFSLAAFPPSLLVASGHSNSSILTMHSLNGFAGTINLSAHVSPFNAGTVVTIFQSMVSMHAGGVATSTLTFQSSQTGTYSVNVTATSPANGTAGITGPISHNVIVPVSVVSVSPPPDFSISANPTFVTINAGQSASLEITLRSINGFSGFVTLSTLPPPFCSQLPCVTWSVSPSTVDLSSGGSFNATLFVTGGAQAASGVITVTGSSGFLSHGTGISYQVLPPPNDFNINVYPSSLIILAGGSATSTVNVYPVIFNGFANFTVTLTASVLPQPGPTATLNPTAVVISPQSFNGFSTLTISTTTTTPVGNYTVTVTGKTGNVVHSVIVNVEILPPPTITITPASGPVGTKVLVQAKGFLAEYGFAEILVTFDDQLVGFSFTSTNSFNFTFNVPVAQVGVHTVKAVEPGFGGSSATATASAPFQVTASPAATNFTVTVNVGTVYFPGDSVKAFILITQNGQPLSPSDLQLEVIIIGTNGSGIVPILTKLSPGVYTVVFNIPTTSKNGATPLGTYAIIVNAHSASIGDSTAQASFEVKPTWITSNGKTLVTGVALVGLAGFVGVAWKKGYFRKKEDELFPAA